MELLKPNYIQTTTGFTVDSNTVTAAYLFDRDPSFQYISSGYANDATTTSIRINFNETLTVSRIALLEHDLKEFRIFYNGVTANTFALSTTAGTTVSHWVTNSATSMYLACTPVACTSVTLDMRGTISANQEKAIGYLVVSQERAEFTRLPSSKDYKPAIEPMQVVHKMSDGGTRLQTISDKWKVDIQLDYVDQTFRDLLYTIWRLRDEHIFVPFGTGTSWDGLIFPCVWEGAFEFYRYSDNSPGAGFAGTIRLRETTE